MIDNSQIFALRKKIPDGTYNLSESLFDKGYPKEAFDITCPDNSPIDSILHYACGIIEESNHFSLSIVCFEERIDLPIMPELMILLEQIERLFWFSRESFYSKAAITFFEQGCEMKMLFEKGETAVDVQLIILNKGKQLCKTLSRPSFEYAVCQFVVDFIAAVGVLAPQIYSYPAFILWFHKLMISKSDLDH